MSGTLVLSASLEVELRDALALGVESAGVLLCGRTVEGGRLTLTGNRILWLRDEDYIQRERDELEVRSAGWVPALAAAAAGGWQPVFLHTHPRMPAIPSERDGVVDRQIAETFRIRARIEDYASVIVGGTPDAPAYTGKVVPRSGEARAIRRVRTVGRRIRVRLAAAQTAGDDSLDAFDRQVRAFGADGQRLLRELRVGVVGAGGTGSAVIEQLGRLGVGVLVLLDDEDVDATNLTRIHGTTAADVGRPKVDVAADAVEALGFGTDVERHHQRITTAGGVAPLRGCDVVFGCTDDEHGRIVLSRLAFWHLIPVFDMGIRLRAPAGTLTGIDGRVTYIAPGEACLICRGRVDLERARDEMYEPTEREQLAEEGYAQSLADPDPAVVAYTTLVASVAVGDLLERLFGFGEPDVAGELLLRLHARKLSRLHHTPPDYHFCGDSTKWGLGDRDPALGHTWA